MGDFISDRGASIAFAAYQHTSLVVQAVLLATIVAILLAALVISLPRLAPVANAISAVGLTLPSFALLGLLIPLVGIGAITAVVAVAFYATLVILRNAVVGLQGVSSVLLESAKGMGMTPLSSFFRVRLPLALPVILAGVRVATQMSMGVAAIAAYALGPGLGSFIFRGLASIGNPVALYYALVGTVGIVILALILDALLLLLQRAVISKGIRV